MADYRIDGLKAKLHFKRTVGHVRYLIGTRGERCTQARITYAWNNFPAYRPQIEACAKKGLETNPVTGEAYEVVDCMGWLEQAWNGGDVGHPLTAMTYPDVTTGVLYTLVKDDPKRFGPIATIPKNCPFPIAVGYTGHVGFYIEGKVYQAAGHCPGTVVTGLTDTTYNKAWEYWYVIPFVNYWGWYVIDASTGKFGWKILKSGMTDNDDVATWQFHLNAVGYDLVVDGEFGSATFDATKDFQKMQGLVIDGIVGEKSQTAMYNVLEPMWTKPPLVPIPPPIDYKVLYEIEKARNEVLQQTINALRLENDTMRKELQEYKTNWGLYQIWLSNAPK